MAFQLNTSESDEPFLLTQWGREGAETDEEGQRRPVTFCLCTWVTMNELMHAE